MIFIGILILVAMMFGRDYLYNGKGRWWKVPPPDNVIIGPWCNGSTQDSDS